MADHVLQPVVVSQGGIVSAAIVRVPVSPEVDLKQLHGSEPKVIGFARTEPLHKPELIEAAAAQEETSP
jgi:hypothetical protein